MEYKKSTRIDGEWVKAAELESGIKGKLVSETKPIEGEYGTQDVSKIIFAGETEPKNVRLNKTTLNGLIDAYGTDSNNWVDKSVTAHTEKALVAGKRVTILYLVPEGYELGEDGGYVVITKGEDVPVVESDEPTF